MRILSFLALVVLGLTLVACVPLPALAPAATPTANIENLPADVDVATVAALRGRSDVVVLDVREPSEYAEGHIPGVKLIPVNDVSSPTGKEVPNRLSEIPRDKIVIVTCRTGNRSTKVAQYLREQGYTNIHNMLGGIEAWQQAGYPVEK